MYSLTIDPNVILRDDGMYIPNGHRFWDDYEEWLSKGNSPIPNVIDEITAIRLKRDSLLQLSDWTQIHDVPVSDELRSEWIAYRQSLRDLPTLPDSPYCKWPIPPE